MVHVTKSISYASDMSLNTHYMYKQPGPCTSLAIANRRVTKSCINAMNTVTFTYINLGHVVVKEANVQNGTSTEFFAPCTH